MKSECCLCQLASDVLLLILLHVGSLLLSMKMEMIYIMIKDNCYDHTCNSFGHFLQCSSPQIIDTQDTVLRVVDRHWDWITTHD